MAEKAVKGSVILFVGAALLFMFWAVGKTLIKQQVNVYPAPPFSLSLLQDREVSLKTFSGKPLMLNFWATWCQPCVEEMPILQEVYARYRDEGLTVIGVAVQDKKEQVQSFIQKHHILFPVGLDTDGILSGKYGINGVPETFFIDRKGNVVAHVPEPLAETTIRGYLEKIL